MTVNAGGYLATLFLIWWYGEEFQNVLQYFETFLVYLYDFFSVRICLSTLFAVWRRDRINYKGLALPDIFQAWTLNLASRIVGFFVKISTMLIYLIVSLLVIIFAAAFIISWLLLPLIVVALIYFGIKIILGS
ncbi:MAG: hypothetical protein Q7S80_03015 [bacterium]|nr:hypothetical protein [bacterium]